MKTLGERLTEVREKAGLTQQALEEAAGVPQTTVSRIERDETKNPNVHTIAKIADALRIPIEALLRDTPTLLSDRRTADGKRVVRAATTALQEEEALRVQVRKLAIEVRTLRGKVEQLESARQKRQAR